MLWPHKAWETVDANLRRIWETSGGDGNSLSAGQHFSGLTTYMCVRTGTFPFPKQ